MSIDHPLWETQVELERSALRDWQAKQNAVFNSPNFINSIPGKAIAQRVLGGFSEAIRSFIDQALYGGQPGPRNAAARLLEELDPEVTAFIATQTLLLYLPRSDRQGGFNLTNLALVVGDRVQDEVRARRFEKENPEYFAATTRDWKRKALPRYKREEYLRRVLKHTEEGWRVWSPRENIRVGMKLVELFNAQTGALVIRRGGKREGYRNRVHPSPDYLDVLHKLLTTVTARSWTYPLMVHPPAPWGRDTLDTGVYNTHHIRALPLIKRTTPAGKARIRGALDDGSLDVTLTALNAVQATPWRVNERVKEAVHWAYESGLQVGGLPAPDHIY